MSKTQMQSVVDQLLTGASQGLVPDGCIADLLLPSLPFAQYTGKLVGYGKNHMRIESTIVGGKGKFRIVEPIVSSTTSFEIESHGLGSILTPRDYKNKTQPFDVEKDEMMGLSSLLMLAKEKGLADTLSNGSIIVQNKTLSGTSQFSDRVNSDPLGESLIAKKAVRAGCGAKVNTIICPYEIAENLRVHPQLLDFLGFKEARPGGLTDQELAKAFQVKKFFVPEAQYNSAKEGQADVLTDVWGKNMIFCVVPDKAEKWQVSLGYVITLDGETVRKVYKNPIFNPPNSTEILVSDEYDMLIANANAAYLLSAAIA